jgi:hypothetical protein
MNVVENRTAQQAIVEAASFLETVMARLVERVLESVVFAAVETQGNCFRQ